MATLWRGVRRCVSQRSRDPATYQLYLVTDDAFLDDQFYYKVEAAIRGGVTCLQLRLKNVSTSVYVSWAQKMRQLTQQHHIPLIVDDRLDVALAVEADGLHVGGDDLPWRTARRLLGSHRILGCSTYGRPELVSAALHPEVNADYLGSGAIFTTPTKASQAKGMEHLPLLRKQVASEGPVPIVAIGGVDLSSAADCVRSGADGVAVVRGILQSSGPEDSEAKAKALLAEVRSALEDRENEKVQPRTILDETDELGKSVDKDVSILIENKPLEKPKKEVQAQTACAAVEKDAKDLKAPEPKVEPSKDAGLPSLNDLPSKSQDALRPLLQRYGEARHKEVFALHTFLGDGQARSSCLRRRCGCALHVWGPAGVGKTEVVTGYLKELGHKYIFLNCYCILSQADLHRKLVMGTMRLAEEAQRAADSKLERFESKLPQQLRAIDRLEAALKAPIAELRRLECSQVLLVLDHVEELIGRIGLPAFELVLALPEVLSYGDMLVPITISRVPLKSLGLRSTREPPHVGFEPYSDSNTLQLLLRHFTKKGGRDIETLNFVIYGLQKMAVPFVGWNLGLLIEVVEMVLDAMPAGAKHDAAVLQPLIEEACRRRVGFVHKPMKDPEAKLIKVSQTMSKAEMRLVLAAYLASRVCKQDDRQLFLGRSTRRKRAVMVRQKDNALPAHVKQPNVVTIPRLLATYHHLARQPRLMGSNIFQALTKLKEAGLVRFVGEKNFKMDKDLKVVCRAELPLAQACAATLNVDLTEYLCK